MSALMQPIRRRRRIAVAGAMLLLCACESSAGSAAGSAHRREDGTSPADVLTRVYNGLLFTARNPEADTLFACVGEGAPEMNVALADYVILSTAVRGDTARAVLELTSAAREIASPHRADRWNATLAVHTDTVREMLLRSPGGWKLCEPSARPIGFVHDGNDAQTSWSPAGASWASVAHVADSIRLAKQSSGRR